MCNMEKKRARGSKFTAEEVSVLVELIEKYKYIIENKQANKVSQKDKKLCWENIMVSFNDISGRQRRTAEELKLKWDNLKKITRKKVAQNKQELNKTGSGISNNTELTPVEQKILIMIKLSAEDLPARFDESKLDTNVPLEKISSSTELSESCKSTEGIDQNYMASCSKKDVVTNTIDDIPFITINEDKGEIESGSGSVDVPSTLRSPHRRMPKTKQGSFKEFIAEKKEVAFLQARYYSKKVKTREDSYINKQRRLEELHQRQMAVLDAKKHFYEEKTKKLREK